MTLNLHQCIMLNKLNISFSNLHFYFTRPHVMVFHVTSKLVIQVYDLNHKLRIECYQLRGNFRNTCKQAETATSAEPEFR